MTYDHLLGGHSNMWGGPEKFFSTVVYNGVIGLHVHYCGFLTVAYKVVYKVVYKGFHSPPKLNQAVFHRQYQKFKTSFWTITKGPSIYYVGFAIYVKYLYTTLSPCCTCTFLDPPTPPPPRCAYIQMRFSDPPSIFKC